MSGPRQPHATRDILLIADDFAISEGVSAGIAQLARAHRISGTSALVTLQRWPSDAVKLAALRGDIAIGLHVNLTLGAPLGPMPVLAPQGELPKLQALVARALARAIDPREVEAEISRQLDRFSEFTGHTPDFIDGHQHVHVLPVIRDALIAAIQRHDSARPFKPLVRVPGDRFGAIAARGQSWAKAFVLSSLAAGFAKALRRAGLPCNGSFAGVTGFGDSEADVMRDLTAATLRTGRLHLVMCHPGVPTNELAALDPVTTRRAAELAVLSRDNVLSDRLCRLERTGDDGAIDWVRLGAMST